MTYTIYIKTISNQEISIRQHDNSPLFEVRHYNLVRNMTESIRTYPTLKQAKQRVYAIVGKIKKQNFSAL